jgi:4-hydroxy-tetrahydrodipicolinate reductase
MIRVAVAGATGRVGRALCAAIDSEVDLELVGRVSPSLGITLEEVLDHAEVVVDFTRPDVTLDNARACLEGGVHFVAGTSGADFTELEGVGSANLFYAPNFALGAVLMIEAAKLVARHMPECEIIEMHHEGKLDAPSGTAAHTARILKEAGAHVHEPIHSVRLPGLVGHQEVLFGGLGQTLSIRHDSLSHESFVPGVLLAVRRVAGLERQVTIGLDALLD